MCIVLRGQDGVIEQARRQLEDLVSFYFPLKLLNALLNITQNCLLDSGMGCP